MNFSVRNVIKGTWVHRARAEWNKCVESTRKIHSIIFDTPLSQVLRAQVNYPMEKTSWCRRKTKIRPVLHRTFLVRTGPSICQNPLCNVIHKWTFLWHFPARRWLASWLSQSKVRVVGYHDPVYKSTWVIFLIYYAQSHDSIAVVRKICELGGTRCALRIYSRELFLC